MRLYRKILVPVDGSPASVRGLREAARLAKAQHAALVLLHVVDELPAFMTVESAAAVDDIIASLVAEGRRILKQAQALAGRLGIKARGILLTRAGGPAADEIVRQAKKLRCDLIVIGTHGRRGVRRLVLGSDAELVVRASPVPVLLLRAPG